MRIAVNTLAFYVAWFACALGGANGWPWTGAAVAVGVVVVHLMLAADWRDEAKLAFASGVLGILGESALIASGAASYASPVPFAAAPPVWLIGMWLAFATLMNVTFTWLKGRLWLAALLGALLGPLSYIGGEALGAIQIGTPYWQSISAIAGLWGLALPILVTFAQRWDGVSDRTSRQ